MWQGFLSALKAAIIWFFNQVQGLFSYMYDHVMSAILALMPTSLHPSVAAFQSYLGALNYWVPLDMIITLWLAYQAISYLVITTRWLKSFVPTIAN